MNTLFASEAVPLLLELEDAALAASRELTVDVTAAGRLRIAPAAVLTPERTTRIQSCRDALRLLVQVASPAVLARTDAFRQQLQRPAASVYPALRFSSATSASEVGCVSCGALVSRAAAWCAECQIAARLARDGDLPADWMPHGMTQPLGRTA